MAPQDEFYEVNLGNILGGKFPERFDKAIKQLIDNMRDVNIAYTLRALGVNLPIIA